MVMDAVVERFIEQSPVTVMARLALQRALDPAWLDALFEQERQQQVHLRHAKWRACSVTAGI